MRLPKYEYQELSEPGSIRLLRFGQCNFDTKSSIEISLEIFKIDEAPPSLALSYCWGKKKAKKDIVCDGKRVRITTTLFEALEHLYPRMDSTSENSLSYLWIDQLCIDQCDGQEKNHQVALMGNIYRGAMRTVVWLGPDQNVAKEAFDLIHQTFAVVEREYPDHQNLETFPIRMFDEELHAERGLPVEFDGAWAALTALLNRPWFKRLWVLQEVVLSREDAFVVCGSEDGSWYVLSVVCEWIGANGYYAEAYCPATVFNIGHMRYASQRKGKLDLASLAFMMSVKFNSTNPRDKVFGLLGLASQDESDRLIPDYSLSSTEVYQNLARDLVCRQGNLAWLNMPLSHNKHIKDSFRRIGSQSWWRSAPSWVPHLNVHTWFQPTMMDRVSTDYKGTGSKLGWLEHYRVSGDVPAKSRDVPSSSGCAKISTLSLKGLRVDTLCCCFEVNTVSSLTWQTQRWRHRTRFEKAGWNDWRQQAYVSYGYVSWMRRPVCLRLWSEVLESRPDLDIVMLARLMCEATTMNQRGNVTPVKDADFDAFCAYMVEIYDAWGGKFRPSHSRFHRSFDVLRQHGEGGISSRYQSLMQTRCHMRRCFITQDGRIGVGPTSMKKGDTVVVLFGGGTPYVLRRWKGKWLFLGGCYVTGIMRGESIQSWRAGELQEEWFDIV
ncbi:hypothetical protein LTR70_008559 [Exophiala xenobiotica]|uniref:Heterokaryon incompatibility domain-containing protein n=1 Tax=Lithohypha guttulata TaxID=1690604 RepID=A0ABR0K194_9EURO|nr:hypothetical protein LTR24_008187 [Lithohypha guttulata]KAK5311833.1 hypothetical protein LTR70_008559 [Exophiala xenobiotica]